MQLCKKCFIPIIEIMSFSKDKHEKFCKCPRCSEETKRHAIKDYELSFGEVLHREINKRK